MNEKKLEFLTEEVVPLFKKGITGGGSKLFMIIQSGAAVIGGFILSLLGGNDQLLRIMVLFVVVDFFLGLAKGAINKNIDSKVMGTGFIRKIIEFTVVGFAFGLQKAFGNSIPLRDIAVIFYLCNEGLSIVENVGACGVPFPSKLKDILVQLKDKPELKAIEKEDEKEEKSNEK